MIVSNEIGTVKVQKINSGYYIRVPNAAVKIIGLKRGELLKVVISTDKRTIRFTREPDTIILPDKGTTLIHDVPARPEPHIQQEQPPAPELEIIEWLRSVFNGK